MDNAHQAKFIELSNKGQLKISKIISGNNVYTQARYVDKFKSAYVIVNGWFCERYIGNPSIEKMLSDCEAHIAENQAIYNEIDKSILDKIAADEEIDRIIREQYEASKHVA